ncbi:unnamed protein product, partial [marine sediment metagenome]
MNNYKNSTIEHLGVRPSGFYFNEVVKTKIIYIITINMNRKTHYGDKHYFTNRGGIEDKVITLLPGANEELQIDGKFLDKPVIKTLTGGFNTNNVNEFVFWDRTDDDQAINWDTSEYSYKTTGYSTNKAINITSDHLTAETYDDVLARPFPYNTSTLTPSSDMIGSIFTQINTNSRIPAIRNAFET